MPYTFEGNWLIDGSDDQRQGLATATVETLSRLHAIPDPADAFAFLDDGAKDAGRPQA